MEFVMTIEKGERGGGGGWGRGRWKEKPPGWAPGLETAGSGCTVTDSLERLRLLLLSSRGVAVVVAFTRTTQQRDTKLTVNIYKKYN